MRVALAARDVGTVYRLLQRIGVSQRRIVGLTGQSQSDVKEILRKGCQAQNGEVRIRRLVRAPTGLVDRVGRRGEVLDAASLVVCGCCSPPGLLCVAVVSTGTLRKAS